MEDQYNFKKHEREIQNFWGENNIFKTKDLSKKPKNYVLDMFPYPSGSGLHVGHIRGYIATDVFSRMKLMQGYNVLHPMGWDAFGLPAENYAIKNKIHPEIAVRENIKNFKKQINKIGLNYDWSREINTTYPDYYKWTQWIFLKMFESGLAFESFEPINWCPSCKTGLANEDLEGSKCERCGSIVEKKSLRQWVLKITKYAERLLSDLKYLDWEDFIIEQQKNWIGKSEGAKIKFQIKDSPLYIEVFTTRIDTIFGCTYLVLAPEHQIIEKCRSEIENFEEVEKYVRVSQQKTDLERIAKVKEKTGVELKGLKAINPFNKEEIPIFIADYVLKTYATGAIMAVPAHDQRDLDFAKKYNLPIKEVVIKPGNKKSNITLNAFEEDGILINSGQFTGLTSKKARELMTKWLKEKKYGKKAVYYKMHDWVFSRQRYWGEPIPLVFCENCKKRIEEKKYKKGEFTKGELLNPGWIQIPEKDLPLKLPKVKYYEPTGTGESPLANIKNWVFTKCPKCNGKARRETNTMPQWAGSCWYFLRYIDPKNKKKFVSKNKEKYWMPVDLYVGGAEHATRHLIYARFWHKFLYDIGVVSTKEPFKKLIHVGIILAHDGKKMSKRWGNVINPNDIIERYGADALRLYEMFIGPFTESISWDPKGIIGVKRFLDKVWKLKEMVIKDANKNSKNKNSKKSQEDFKKLLHKIIKKVSEDIENFKFNTAISQLMVLANEMEKLEKITEDEFCIFLKLLSPFAPHMCEKIWLDFGNKKSIHLEKWPQYNSKLIQEDVFNLVIQINGKVRDVIEMQKSKNQKEIEKIVFKREKVKKWIKGQKVKKIIYIKNRLINIII